MARSDDPSGVAFRYEALLEAVKEVLDIMEVDSFHDPRTLESVQATLLDALDEIGEER